LTGPANKHRCQPMSRLLVSPVQQHPWRQRTAAGAVRAALNLLVPRVLLVLWVLLFGCRCRHMAGGKKKALGVGLRRVRLHPS
jgi:hypothetical protein